MIEEKDVNQIMYAAITVIVDKGKAEQVVEAAIAAGSNGGTIINARSSGIHENEQTVFDGYRTGKGNRPDHLPGNEGKRDCRFDQGTAENG